MDYQFSLKHRLIGAAILISFGVIILPWILGSYSSPEQNSENSVQSDTVKPNVKLTENDQLKQQKQDESANDTVKNEVKVFVSRVQPLDNQGKAVEPKKVEEKPKKKEKPKKAEKNNAAASKPQKPKIVEKKEKKEVAKKAPVKKTPAKSVAIVERGYIVSVGVFGNTKNVDKMLADLRSKQFKPSVRKETFNDKSVSRIFMGPFATRAEAGRIKLQLSEKGNIPSLIKEFP